MKELKRIRREASIHAVTRILSAGQPTKFEFESACRHGLRSGMCIDGQPWTKADQKSAVLVDEALRRLGAERPTWSQGQPEYVSDFVEHLFCTRCGGTIPEERKGKGNASVRYCSDLCHIGASGDTHKRDGRRVATVEALAARAARHEGSLRERVVDCEQCRRPFLRLKDDQKFCSRRCSDLANTKHPSRPCEHCGEIFKPPHDGGIRRGKPRIAKFCSKECVEAHRLASRIERQCETCGNTFVPRRADRQLRFCSRPCWRQSLADVPAGAPNRIPA